MPAWRGVGGENAVRALLIGLGVVAAARGGQLLLAAGMQRSQLISLVIWLAAGSLAHDLVIAPVSLLLGRALTRVLGRPVALGVTGNALRGAWLAAGSAALIGYTLHRGAQVRRNPTVIPGHPVVNVLVSLALVLAGAALVIAVSRVRARRARPAPGGPPAPTVPTSP